MERLYTSNPIRNSQISGNLSFGQMKAAVSCFRTNSIYRESFLGEMVEIRNSEDLLECLF